jgi:cell division protein ZapA
MPTIEVLVNGRRHAVQCGQGEEARVRQLASYVDRRIAELARGQTQVGDARLLLMASLVVADELSDAFDEIKRLRATLDGQGGGTGEREAAGALEQAARRIEAIAAELESA